MGMQGIRVGTRNQGGNVRIQDGNAGNGVGMQGSWWELGESQ